MATRVLVAYASKNGGTEEIARAVADTLQAAGLRVDVKGAGQIRDLSPYDAVVLGSAVYMGRWRPEAVRFLNRHHKDLRRQAVWLFDSGPLDRTAPAKPQPLPNNIQAIARRIHVRGRANFGGRLDDTAEGFIAHAMLKNGQGGDFRDFERIRRWAAEVVDDLTSSVQPGAA